MQEIHRTELEAFSAATTRVAALGEGQWGLAEAMGPTEIPFVTAALAKAQEYNYLVYAMDAGWP